MISLGPFDLLQPVAQGGMGEVWRGVHRASGVWVAVKVLTAVGAREASTRRALQDEVRAVAALDHPNVVWVHDTGVVEHDTPGALVAGSPYLVLELADGGTVKDRLRALTWPDVHRIASEVLAGLAHAHARGVVHRDLKPANLLLHGPDATVKLTDFGIAHALDRLDDRIPTDGEALDRERIQGTPNYMAPEQFDGRWRDQGPWTDLYALGCLVWLCVTASRPFEARGWVGQALARQLGQLAPFRARWEVPDGVEPWLRRCLAVDPADRFQFAAEAAASWSALEGEDAPGVPTDWRPAVPRAERDPQLLGAGLGLFGLRANRVVGRSGERGALWAALTDARECGGPRAMVLRGPAGCGKSRLAEWLCTRARELGAAEAFRAVHGVLPGPDDGITGMLARALRCLGAEPDDRVDRVHEVVPDGADAAAIVELLSPTAEGAPGHRRFTRPEERYVLVLRTLQRVARGGPLVLWLDDVVFGPDSTAFARWVLDNAAGSVLLLLTVPDEALADRPETAAVIEALEQRPAAEALAVGPLTEPQLQTMVQELLRVERGLAREVAQRTAGNPLFAVQLVGDWVERGLLHLGPHGFRRAPGASDQLPETLQQVWASRVARVVQGRSPEELAGLQVAAILGARVDRAEWASACARVGATASTSLFAELVEQRLARVEPGGWSFVHGMLSEAIAGEAVRSGRHVEQHLACAHMLGPRSSAVDLGRRGRHLLAAGRWEQAAELLFRGALQATNTDTLAAELMLVEHQRALEAHGVGASDERWLRAEARLALCMHLIGRYEEAEARCAPLRECSVVAARLMAMRVVGEQARMQGRFEDSIACWQTGRLDALASGSHALLALFQRGLGLIAAHQGRLQEAREWLGKALDAYRSTASHQEFDALLALAYVEHLAGDTEAFLERTRQATRAARATGTRAGLGLALNLWAEHARAQGQLAEAEGMYHEALQHLEATASAEQHVARVNLGLMLLERGQFEQAAAQLEATLPAGRRMERTLWLMTVHMALMACDPVGPDFADHLVRFEALATSSRYVDPDLARIAVVAARRARQLDQPERADVLFALAHDQWSGLGRSEEAASAEQERLSR